MSYSLSDYNYNLPENRIAQHPITPAHKSKLLSCIIQQDHTVSFSDHHCFDLPTIVEQDTLLIANNSQVFASRIPLQSTTIILKNWKKTILESWEIFIVRVLFHQDGSLDTTQCIIRWSDKKHFKPWCTIYFDQSTYGKSVEFVDDGIVFQFYNTNLIDVCKQYGDLPLPPYITEATSADKEHYKTSFWQHIWSVATPTAGLHFTSELRQQLLNNHIQRKEITLHVGIGTFAPVVSSDIRNHSLHAELITIDRNIFETIYTQKSQNRKIITIGTTSTRSIESLPMLRHILSKDQKSQHCSQACQSRRDLLINSSQKNNNFLLLISDNSTTITFSSSLFIYPWFDRKIIDGLITNFHLPQTSLVMLVAGMMWYNNWKQTYQYALDHDYRFASFGDAMYIVFNS
jgi:S-adenosylmethionine:tRNA ribosyltransferase-isomerase